MTSRIVTPYKPKVAEQGSLFDTFWTEAQAFCNFVLFEPTWLPADLTEDSNKMRPESPSSRASHKSEYRGPSRALSIKQFLYDWAPPAYDHPCLWRNAEISKPEETPLPKAYLMGNNYIWVGLDHRRKAAATINMMRTQIEITVMEGSFDDQDLIQIVCGLAPVNSHAKDSILATSFAELMFNHRQESETISVPTSYFKHTRQEHMKCYPYSAKNGNLNLEWLPGNWLADSSIENYRLDSVILFGLDRANIQEAEYYFESTLEPGSYIRFLVTKSDDAHAIKYPPALGDQECNSAVIYLDIGGTLYHAWSKVNDNGCHTLIFKIRETVINCIVKPAPWTSVDWARELYAAVYGEKPHEL